MRALLAGLAALALGLTLGPSAHAQAVPVSLPDTVVYRDVGDVAGVAFSVPLTIDADVTGRGISSADVKLSYDPAVLSLTGYETGALASGCTDFGNTSTAGEVTVVIACGSTNALAGSGVLVTFSGTLVAEGSSALTLTDTTPFNEGGVPADITDGRLRIVTDPDPSLGALEDQTIDEDSTASFEITLSDDDTDPEDLVVTASASTGLVGSEGFVVGTCEGQDETSACRTLTVTPAADANGTATITVTVTDNDTRSDDASETFVLTVEAVNDAPVVANAVDDQDLPAGNVPLELALSSVFSDVDDATLAYSVTSSMEAVASVTLADDVASVSPLAIGETTVTLRATDADGLFAEETFVLTVTAGVAAEDDRTVPFALRAPQPNPTSGATTLHVDLPAAASVRVEVYDSVGRLVQSSPPRALSAGPDRRVSLDLDAHPPGVYLYRLIAEEGGRASQSASGQLTIVR